MTEPSSPPSAGDDQWKELRERLAELRARAGQPSTRQIAQMVRRATGLDSISHTTVNHAVSRGDMPAQRYVLAIVRALGGRDEDFLPYWGMPAAGDPDDAFPQASLLPAQLRGVAVLPVAADDRWVPRSQLRALAAGRRPVADLARRRWRLQHREIMRALMVARTIVINRSFLINNPVLFHGFTGTPRNRVAFVRLLTTSVIVPFLFRERNLLAGRFADRPGAEEAMAIWREILEPAEAKYLRLSWDETENNGFTKDLGAAFTERFRTAVDLDLDLVLAELHAHELDARGLKIFLNRILLVELPDGAKLSLDRGTLYGRYVDTDGALDVSKPHMAALKWLLDLIYHTNLSEALGLPLLSAADSVHRSVVYKKGLALVRPEAKAASRLPDRGERGRTNVLGMIQDALFLRDRVTGRYAVFENLELADVFDLRRSGPWVDYIMVVERLVEQPWMLSHPQHGMMAVLRRYDRLVEHIGRVGGQKVAAR